ncbi:helix-turn-helix domain-containing protein [Methylobacterium sp. WL30]|uniref:helix-turn-helix domain-containing protein n=1 Tax=unclassified Methylobacterium TaxID=2615210 RepID=UPI0011CCC10F|nr:MULTISPECIES: helix-turn-helix domain-containing protein [unclassified Methylobacterium]TXN40677.1 helix-turn-helix domain-containing protein [Methylobacterium sp. WL93]TXN50001.1 helix-turn-helix domain-containing protein [Methylobacterium sp. WL119]TXN60461.1 helix-turn-helix domain-containing protein [Methylobacterium sp. WL30]
MPPPARPSAKPSDLDQIVAETAARVADSTIVALQSMFSESFVRGVIEREAKIAVQAAFLAEAERARIGTSAPSPQPEPSKAVQQPVSRPTAYRINGAMKELGVGRTKLYELIASGALPARKRDGVTYIRAVDLEAYADGQPIMGGAQ